MKGLAFLSLIFISHVSFAFEPPVSEVTLVSSDGQQFTISKKVAEKSETIKMMLSDVGADQVPLSNIDGKTLQVFIDIAQKELVLGEGKKDKELLDYLEPNVAKLTMAEKYKLLLAANYLDYQILLNVVARSIAKGLANKPFWLEKSTGRTGKYNWQINLGVLRSFYPKDLEPLLAKYCYLVSGKNLPGVDENSYGFSIPELMEYGRFDRKIEIKYGENILNLSKLRLNSLDGLNAISDIQTVRELYLSYNKLSSLPAGLFNGLSNLQRLYLFSNELTSLPVGVFNGLSSLKKLCIFDNEFGRFYWYMNAERIQKEVPLAKIDK